jgi:dihydrofolate synthase / folylpolyglutamate synthase
MEYQQAIQFLYQLRFFGTKLGLENTFRLAALLGNPQDRLRFVHVAGTNGKGSTCAMLEGIYRRAGLKVGLFTSPHLVSFTERIQIDRRCINEADVTRFTQRIIDCLGGSDTARWEFRPTFFEFVTVMALIYFREQNCDLVIWETGMGGRLDATSIVMPIASVITNIQLDHQQWLGHSHAEIAREKAGIIKPGVPVITGTDIPEALEVIRARAEELRAPLTIVHSIEPGAVSLLGAHQRKNAALARATAMQLQSLIPVEPEDIAEALASTFWPGRLQLATLPKGRVLLDGAHNVDGARTLGATLREQFSGEPITLVLGLFKDKDWREMCQVLVPMSQRVFLVPVQSERTADPALVRDFCRAEWPNIPLEPCQSLRDALDGALGQNLSVVAGSLHLVGEAMELLGLAPGLKPERELNEWDAARAKQL